MLGHQGLDEQRAALRIETRRNPVGGHVVRVRDDLGRVGVVAGQRVPVGHEVEAIVLRLEGCPVVERADEVSEMELAGRAHARNDARLHRRSNSMKNSVGGLMSWVRIPVSISA